MYIMSRRKRGGNENSKSKLVLVLLTLTGLSFFGLDRMYAGQIGMGIGKLLSLGGLGIWFLVDGLRVLYNALTKSQEGLFGITSWNDDIELAFKVALGIIVLQLIGSVVGGIVGAVTTSSHSAPAKKEKEKENTKPATKPANPDGQTDKEGLNLIQGNMYN